MTVSGEVETQSERPRNGRKRIRVGLMLMLLLLVIGSGIYLFNRPASSIAHIEFTTKVTPANEWSLKCAMHSFEPAWYELYEVEHFQNGMKEAHRTARGRLFGGSTHWRPLLGLDPGKIVEMSNGFESGTEVTWRLESGDGHFMRPGDTIPIMKYHQDRGRRTDGKPSFYELHIRILEYREELWDNEVPFEIPP